MYVVVKVGSSQYKVAEGDILEATRLKNEKGKTISLDKVMLYANGKDIRIGQPFLKDVKVSAKVVEHSLDDKVIAFKFRKRKDSCTRVGHRTKLTALNITKIDAK